LNLTWKIVSIIDDLRRKKLDGVYIPGGPQSGASAYFCLFLLNALTKSNNFRYT